MQPFRLKALELRHFRYFAAVAEELHFGRAAQRLHIVQPALTAQIKSLERILGAELLNRSKRHVELTAAGRQFLKEAYLTLAQVDSSVENTLAFANGMVGTLRIGYGANAAVSGLVQQGIQAYQIKWPEVGIELREMAGSEVVAALVADELDVGYAATANASVETGLSARRVGSWRWLLAVPEDHRFAKRTTVEVLDVVGERLAVYSESGTRLDRASIAAALPNMAYDRIHQSSHIISLMTYVGSGLGIAFVPEPISSLLFPGVVFINMEGDVPEMVMNLLWSSSSESPLVRNLIAMLHD